MLLHQKEILQILSQMKQIESKTEKLCQKIKNRNNELKKMKMKNQKP